MIFLLVSAVLAEEWWGNTHSFLLTKDNLLDTVGNDRHVVINFISTTEDASYRAFIEWEGVWEIFNDPNSDLFTDEILVSHILVNFDQFLTEMFRIDSTPTIVYIPSHSMHAADTFQGEAVKEDIVDWMMESIEYNSEDTYYQYEIVIEDSDKAENFDKLYGKLDEIKDLFSEDYFTKFEDLKALTKESFRENKAKYDTLKNMVDTLEFNIINRNKSESAHTRFNLSHMLVFTVLGAVIGISLGLVALKPNKFKEHI